MAWRFTPSKYKNTAPATPKKEDTIYDLPIGNLSCTNNVIHANDKLLAFIVDGEGGKIGLLPVGARGRRLRGDLNILCAHSEGIADFGFMRFDNLLATCAGGGEKLKIWSCDTMTTLDEVVMTSECRSEIDVSQDNNVRTILDCLAPHKTARNIIGAGLGVTAPVVVDLEKGNIIIALQSEKIDRSLALDWTEDGSLLCVSTNKGKSALLFDPRASKSSICSINLHSGIGRENRLVFADGNLVSSGFTANRAQEVLLYDSRDWSMPVQNEVFEGSTGLLLPLYDVDSKLLFLVGKGAHKFFLTEIKSAGQPSINRLGEHMMKEQTLGACILPKTACDVMSGEVQRLHQLTKSGIVPIPCIVPRRSYQQFHSDLFPDTVGRVAGNEAQEWLAGSNELPSKIKLGPQMGDSDVTESSNVTSLIGKNVAAHEVGAKACKSSVHYQDVFVRNKDENNKSTENSKSEHSSSLDSSERSITRNENGSSTGNVAQEDTSDKENSKKLNSETISTKAQKTDVSATPVVRLRSAALPQTDPNVQATIVATNDSVPVMGIRRSRPKSCVVGTVQSKFRHVEVIAGANKSVFTNLRNVNNRLPTESDGFCISLKYAALPLSGTAGIISIFELVVPMKIPDGIIDGLQNRSQVMDLQWNPFRPDELAVALDNGSVNIWRIDDKVACIGSPAFTEIIRREKEEEKPMENKRLLSDLQPFRVLHTGQQVRVTHVRYHPTVRDLFAIGLVNGCIQLWNVAEGVRLHEIKGHTQSILSLAWSADGRRLASVGRDAYLKVYEPLLGDDCCIAEARVLDGTRAARVLFVCEDSLILIVGFSKSSARQCALFRINNDAESGNLHALHTETIDVSTQPLVPYYDYDTSVVFLTGKGDRTIQMFEVCPEPPHFLRLTPTTFSVGHQSIALYQKNACDVRDVEFACGWRLTEKIIEKLSFKVPRVRKELFQRDVFPHALVSWEPTGSAAEWKDGVLNRPKFVDLRPDGMKESEPMRH